MKQYPSFINPQLFKVYGKEHYKPDGIDQLSYELVYSLNGNISKYRYTFELEAQLFIASSRLLCQQLKDQYIIANSVPEKSARILQKKKALKCYPN